MAITEPAKLRITHSNSHDTSTSAILDQEANYSVSIQFEDAVGAEAFGVGIGEYDRMTATWTLRVPYGSSSTLSGNQGTVADPKTFTPDIANRYLCELLAWKYVNDGTGAPIPGTEWERFTVVLDIQEACVLADNGDGCALPATGESDETGIDGWSSSAAGYFSAIPKLLGGRRLVVAMNSYGALLDYGKLVTLAATPYSVWKNVTATAATIQNHILSVDGADATDVDLQSRVLGLNLRSTADGSRTVVLLEGILPFNTVAAGFNVGDVLYVSDNAGSAGDLVTVPPALPNVQRPVGVVLATGTGAGAAGLIYFSGTPPAVVSGGTTTSASCRIPLLEGTGLLALLKTSAGFTYDATPGAEVLHVAGRFYYEDVAYSQEVQHLSPGATCTINWNEGNNQNITFDQNCQLTFTDPPGPCHLTLRMIQPGAGGKVVSWPVSGAVKWSGAVAPTWDTTGSRENYAFFYWNGINYIGSGVTNVTP